MKEQGYIIKIENTTATVEVRPHEACSKCCSCGAGKKRQVIVTSPNVQDMTIGQEVEVEVDDKVMLKVWLLLYGLPLVAFLAGLLVTNVFTKEPIIAFLAGLACTILTFLAVGRFLRNKPSYSPSIRAAK